LIGCGQAGRAVVVDPGRDRVHEYLRLARRRGLTITHVIETHTHADHISGNRDLAAATRAPIFAHATAGFAFDHERLSDGDALDVGARDVGEGGLHDWLRAALQPRVAAPRPRRVRRVHHARPAAEAAPVREDRRQEPGADPAPGREATPVHGARGVGGGATR